jgi:hypothetical protein
VYLLRAVWQALLRMRRNRYNLSERHDPNLTGLDVLLLFTASALYLLRLLQALQWWLHRELQCGFLHPRLPAASLDVRWIHSLLLLHTHHCWVDVLALDFAQQWPLLLSVFATSVVVGVESWWTG